MKTNNLVDQSIKTDLTWQPSAGQQIEAGIQFSKLAIDYAYKQNDTLTVLGKNDRGNLLTAYVSDRLSLLDNRLMVTPGLRATQYGVTGKLYAEPRLSAAYKVKQPVSAEGGRGAVLPAHQAGHARRYFAGKPHLLAAVGHTVVARGECVALHRGGQATKRQATSSTWKLTPKTWVA